MVNKKISLFNYLKMDLYRAIFSWKFIIAYLGVLLSLFLGCVEIHSLTNVLSVVSSVIFGISLLLCFIFSSLAYGSCFCEDFENNYFRCELIRGNTKKYVLSKVIIILITSILTIIIGLLLFVTILHLFIPWVDLSSSSNFHNIVEYGKFKFLLKNYYFIFYFVSLASLIGMLAGILSLISAYVSLYISNRLLILTIPSMSLYFFDGILSPMEIYFMDIFTAPSIVVSNTPTTVLIILGVTLLCATILYFAILKKVERKMKNE